jgi:amino acid transporter
MSVSTEVLSEDRTGPRLRGDMGTAGLFFSMLAYNAPLVVVLGSIPLMLFEGNGIGTPMIFIIAGVILACFANGFVRMSKALPRPGAFYSFITAGLGREAGLGAGLLLLGAYFCIVVGSITFGGIVLEPLVSETLHGPHAPWYVWSAVFWVATAVLGYLRVDLSAKVMGVLLSLELLVVAVFDISVVARGGGASGFSATPFHPSHLFDGSFAIGLLLAMGVFGGFEVAVLFRDELRAPDRSIPRATFAVIATAGVLYLVTTWLFVDSQGVDQVVGIVGADPAGAFISAFHEFSGRFTADAATALINTSTFASLLCAHNIASRYAFNLSADGILPRALSGVHSKHGSPHRASAAVSVLAAVVFIGLVVSQADAYQFYGATLGLAALGGVIAFFLSNAAVVRYMRREGREETFLHGTVLPLIAAVGLGATVVLTVTNFAVLTGGSVGLSIALMIVVAAIFLTGVVMARVFRRRRPEVYQRIGRQ